MPKINVNIQPAVIRWVLSQADESQIGSKLMQNSLKWLDGTKTPTFSQIEDFSKKTNIPLGYFFLQEPPVEKLDLLEFRTIDSVQLAKPSRNLVDTIQEMERIQNWMKEYRKETGFAELPIVGSMRDSSDAMIIADQIRNDLDLEKNWYENCKTTGEAFNIIRTQLEQSGVVVMLNGIVGKNTHRTLNIDEFRAFAIVDIWAPLIFINSVDSQKARLFSLFHEIAHIWLGENDFYNDRKNDGTCTKKIEVICNAVAGELMAPKDAFIEQWKETNEKDIYTKISVIARRFKCGDSVIARKAFDAGKINRAVYNKVVENAIKAYQSQKENKEANGGNYYNTMGTRLDGGFVRALCESIQSGRTSYTEAYRLTNTSRKTFQQVAAGFGGIQ